MNGNVKVYCITFGVLDVNLGALQQYLYDSTDIIAFWNYIPLVYCIKTRLLASDLILKLRPFFPHGTFMVAEVNPNNLNGILPQEAWHWFYLNHHEKTHPPALSYAASLFPFLPPPKG
jgi:hypothetical protein